MKAARQDLTRQLRQRFQDLAENTGTDTATLWPECLEILALAWERSEGCFEKLRSVEQISHLTNSRSKQLLLPGFGQTERWGIYSQIAVQIFAAIEAERKAERYYPLLAYLTQALVYDDWSLYSTLEPWAVAHALARDELAELGRFAFLDHLGQAALAVGQETDQSLALFSTLTALRCLVAAEHPPQLPQTLLNRLWPQVQRHYEPERIIDTLTGAGTRLLAYAAQYPRWAIEAGLVQFYGLEYDSLLLLVAQLTTSLYGLPQQIQSPLVVSAEVLARYPDQAQEVYWAYHQAWESGQDEWLDEIITYIELNREEEVCGAVEAYLSTHRLDLAQVQEALWLTP